MEVKMNWKGLFLLAALFGAAGMASGQEAETVVTTDTPPVTTEVVPTEIANYYDGADAGYIAPAPGFGGIGVNGYFNGGGLFNTHGVDYNMVGADSDNKLNVNGAYLAVAKEAQTGCGMMDWGFGADVMFGTDARLLSGYTGWDSEWETGKRSSDYNGVDLDDAAREGYGGAMPQLYSEMSLNNWSIKVGHFYTLMGYESARADQRFFYGFARSFESSPITHSGALAAFKGISNLDLTIGWVAGVNNTFEREYDESLITGAVDYRLDGMTGVRYAFLVGKGTKYGLKGDRFHNNVVLRRTFNDRWDGALLFNYGSFDAGDDAPKAEVAGNFGASVLNIGAASGNVEYQTWAGYLFYTLNPCWKIGSRTEWQRATTDYGAEGAETFNFGFGANWTPCGIQNLVVRPEIRYDNSHLPDDKMEGLFGMNNSFMDQLTLGIDMVCKF